MAGGTRCKGVLPTRGYAVIQTTAGRVTDIGQYTITSNKPTVMYREETGWPALPGGRMMVEEIELDYYTADTSHCGLPGTEAPPLYIQPAWRFSGHYENGLEFEILVQAAPEAYRQP